MSTEVLVRPAVVDDDGAIFTLQRAAFVDEARIYETPFVPSLDETLDELSARLRDSMSWVAVDGHRVVGALSLRGYGNDVPHVERVMVAPDRRGSGITRKLFAVVESYAREQGYPHLQLIVGDLATANRSIYRHLGWEEQGSEALAGFEHVLLHTMTKQL